MNREEALERARAGAPLRGPRELVFALRELQRARTEEGSPVWYLLNKMQRIAMDAADRSGDE
jgi:hypothetical protein